MKKRNVLTISLDREENGEYVSTVRLGVDSSETPDTKSPPQPDITKALTDLLGRLIHVGSTIISLERGTIMLEQLEEKSNAAKPN